MVLLDGFGLCGSGCLCVALQVSRERRATVRELRKDSAIPSSIREAEKQVAVQITRVPVRDCAQKSRTDSDFVVSDFAKERNGSKVRCYSTGNGN